MSSESHPADLLRFITCGSVDDGKSTLIGRLLTDTHSVPEDQAAQLDADSRRTGSCGDQPDYALLLDGLAAEREQGITIDVAYRQFATHRRSFIVADTPGHEQYTRNMITGASTAEAAVVLVDARNGVLRQTRRHAHLLSLIGVRHVALAINKMDLVDWDPRGFAAIEEAFATFARRIGLEAVTAIPVCAVTGENVAYRGDQAGWYGGPSLLDWLESIPLEDAISDGPFRMPVQWVNRPGPRFRGYAGRIISGAVRPGDRVMVLPSKRETVVERIVLPPSHLKEASAGLSVTLTLGDAVDVSRGDVIVSAQTSCEMADQFEATIVWMGDEPMLPGRRYLLKQGARTVGATVTSLRHKIDVNTQEKLAARRLAMNEVAVCHLALDQDLVFEPYSVSRDLGGFILIDRMSNHTIAAGMIRFQLRRSDNLHWQAIDVDRHVRAAQKDQLGRVVWLTGLSGAGKSTIANLVDRQLTAMGRHTYLLDGDNVRQGLNRDLGFTEQDRVENIRRVAEVARLMADAGLIVLTAFISPFRAERQMARDMMEEGEFLEVYVDTPLPVAEARDVKGLYGKARAGHLENFTGIDSPYEAPDQPDIHIDTTSVTAEQAADEIVRAVLKN